MNFKFKNFVKLCFLVPGVLFLCNTTMAQTESKTQQKTEETTSEDKEKQIAEALEEYKSALTLAQIKAILDYKSEDQKAVSLGDESSGDVKGWGIGDDGSSDVKGWGSLPRQKAETILKARAIDELLNSMSSRGGDNMAFAGKDNEEIIAESYETESKTTAEKEEAPKAETYSKDGKTTEKEDQKAEVYGYAKGKKTEKQVAETVIKEVEDEAPIAETYGDKGKEGDIKGYADKGGKEEPVAETYGVNKDEPTAEQLEQEAKEAEEKLKQVAEIFNTDETKGYAQWCNCRTPICFVKCLKEIFKKDPPKEKSIYTDKKKAKAEHMKGKAKKIDGTKKRPKPDH